MKGEVVKKSKRDFKCYYCSNVFLKKTYQVKYGNHVYCLACGVKNMEWSKNYFQGKVVDLRKEIRKAKSKTKDRVIQRLMGA